MRKIWLAVKVVLVVVVVAAAGVGGYVYRTWDRIWDVPAPELHASSDPGAIARGEYLIFGPSHCAACHAGTAAEYDEATAAGVRPPLKGGFALPLGPLGTLYSKNLTPDPETGIGRYSDPQIARLLRHAVRPNGRATIGDLMPFGGMSDEDIVGILSYLRAQAPVRNVVPENQWTMFGKVMKSFVPAALPRLDVAPPAVAPAQAVSVERGEYLARSAANCGGCHSPFNPTTGALTGPRFSGGNAMEPFMREGVDPSVFFRPPNITPLLGGGLMKFPDRDTFVARFKVGGRQYQGSPMPWEAFATMSKEDIGAIYEYLHQLPASGEQSPQEPTVAGN